MSPELLATRLDDTLRLQAQGWPINYMIRDSKIFQNNNIIRLYHWAGYFAPVSAGIPIPCTDNEEEQEENIEGITFEPIYDSDWYQ